MLLPGFLSGTGPFPYLGLHDNAGAPEAWLSCMHSAVSSEGVTPVLGNFVLVLPLIRLFWPLQQVSAHSLLRGSFLLSLRPVSPRFRAGLGPPQYSSLSCAIIFFAPFVSSYRSRADFTPVISFGSRLSGSPWPSAEMSSDVEEMRLIRVARGLRTRAEQRHDAATKVLSASLSAQEENDEAREQPQGLVWGEQKSGVGKRWSETRFGGRGHWKAERDRRAFFRPASFARASESEDEEAVGREGREGAAAEESGEDSEGRSLSSTFMRTKKAAENAKRATRRASEPGDSSAEPCASSVSRESPDKSCAFMAEDENEHEDLGPDRRANSDASPNHVPDDDDYLLGLDPEPPSAILVSDHHQTKERTARNESSQNRVVRSEVRGPVGKKDVINESDEEDTLEVLDPDADGAAALRRTMGLPCAFGEARASREANRQRIVRERFRNAAEDTGTRKTPGQIPSGRAKGAKEPSEEEGRASDEDASQPRSTTQNGGQARKGGRDGVTEGWSEREGRGEEERWRAMGLPVSLEVSVPAHSPSIVSAFALNPKANRMVRVQHSCFVTVSLGIQ